MATELLEQVLTSIVEDPDHWEQSSWAAPSRTACGTSYCIAGHALVKSGEYKTIQIPLDYRDGSPWPFIVPRDFEYDPETDNSIPTVDYIGEGARLLGLSIPTAKKIFVYWDDRAVASGPAGFADWVRGLAAADVADESEPLD